MLHKDAWLSEYFDQGAYAYKPPFDEGALPRGFICAKVPADDIAAVQVLCAQGFNVIETLVHFKQIAPTASRFENGVNVRLSRPEDRQAVVDIARNAFTSSRLYQDAQIPFNTACAIKADWVDNFYSGKRGDRMIVAEEDGKILGFMLMIGAVIDLVAVSKDAYQKGVGTQMLDFANQEIGLLSAGTQIINAASVAFYQKNNFILDSAMYVLHRHG